MVIARIIPDVLFIMPLTDFHNTEHGTLNTEQYNGHLFTVHRGHRGGIEGASRGKPH